MTQPEPTKQDVLRVKAKQHREMAKELLIWSAKLEAEARLLDEGIENPSTELIEQEAGGTRKTRWPEPLVITHEEYRTNADKYTRIAQKRLVHVEEDGVRVGTVSVPRRPIGLGYDLDSVEKIR